MQNRTDVFGNTSNIVPYNLGVCVCGRRRVVMSVSGDKSHRHTQTRDCQRPHSLCPASPVATPPPDAFPARALHRRDPPGLRCSRPAGHPGSDFTGNRDESEGNSARGQPHIGHLPAPRDAPPPGRPVLALDAASPSFSRPWTHHSSRLPQFTCSLDSRRRHTGACCPHTDT